MKNLFTIRTMMAMGILFAVVISSCVDQQPADDGPEYDGPPSKIISLDASKKQYDSYTERRIPIIKEYEDMQDSTQKFSPTRYGEYDLETIKHYISYVENEAEMAKVSVKGLRFYFANYPADGDFGEFSKHNTLMILPTTDFNGEELGFYIQISESGDRTAVPIRDYFAENPAGIREEQGMGYVGGASGMGPKMLLINPLFQDDGGSGMNSLIMNETHIVPPPPQDDDFGGN